MVKKISVDAELEKLRLELWDRDNALICADGVIERLQAHVKSLEGIIDGLMEKG